MFRVHEEKRVLEGKGKFRDNFLFAFNHEAKYDVLRCNIAWRKFFFALIEIHESVSNPKIEISPSGKGIRHNAMGKGDKNLSMAISMKFSPVKLYKINLFT